MRIVIRIMLGLMAASPLLSIGLISMILGLRLNKLPLEAILLTAILGSVILYAAATGYFLYITQVTERFDERDKKRLTYTLFRWFPFSAV
jgi:hypothetical protein